MYYLVNEHADVKRRIVTEKHPAVQMHIKEAVNPVWKNPDKIIKWMWGIIKQSENIKDLLEPGDLVMYEYESGQDEVKVTGCLELDTQAKVEIVMSTKYVINKIYKSNIRGDYILAWARE
jgi:hypothetical protein